MSRKSWLQNVWCGIKDIADHGGIYYSAVIKVINRDRKNRYFNTTIL
jgi:hypothetical protein